MKVAKVLDWWMSGGASFDLDTGFDVINLQSNSASRFVLAGNAISSWLDISGNNNHATQSVAGNKPQYNSGFPSYDGNDQLTLTSEISRTVFSLYIVFKRTTVNATSMCLFGAGDGSGGNTNNFFRLDGNSSSVERQVTWNKVNRPATANATGVWRLGEEENYNVISIRRNGGTVTIKMNDRTCIQSSINANFNTYLTYISKIGSAWNSTFLTGNIVSFSMRTDVVDDATDLAIRNSLFNRYGLLTLSQSSIGYLGDSMTQGGAIANTFPSFVNAQSVAMGLPYFNCGIAGEKASDGLARYQSQMFNRPYTSKKIQVLFGANDINAIVSPATFGANMRAIFVGFLSRGYSASNLMICTPTYQFSGAHASELDAYKAEVVSIRNDLGIKMCDLLLAMRNHADPDSLIGDAGIHPNATGNAFIATTAAAAWSS